MLTKKFRLAAALAAFVGIAGFSSCLKSNDTGSVSYASAVQFFFAAPTGDSLNVYDNNKLLNTSGSIPAIVTSIVPGGFDPGNHLIQFKTKAGASYPDADASLAIDSTRSYWAVVLYDNAPVRSESWKEDFSKASTTKANIRFWNLCKGMPAIDLYLGTNRIVESAEYANVRSAYARQFTNVDAVYSNVIVKDHNADTVIAELKGVQFAAGYIDNFVLTGKVGGTGNTAIKLSRMALQ
ncbi:uncharacterized protein DUF4397 [Chitinophaga skermanii]|uniref:Uncharacterized protein DUF4397 n=1 Tax=Chitinophaga skermanii TaxID=331697 RepID=A0A327QF65_9BACT|nr:DUF4397 domain-containing protein [Chitinophaga skermanii]RAJ02262.1 uncharacterized protein DUF4397 [Chitinophaga skermanii]